jgi:hypothetical protein
MSRRYALDHKNLILKLLANFKGDVVATSRYTGVPERTLREWRNEQQAAAMRQRAAVQKAKMSQQRQPPS